MPAPRRRPSIARPIFLLVIAAIVLANALTFAITFAGPPPRPAPVPLSDVVAALRGERRPSPEGETLRATIGPAAPTARAGEMGDPVRDAILVTRLGAGELRGFYAQRARGPDTALRGSFTIGQHTPAGWRIVRGLPDRLFARWLTITLVTMAAATLVMAAAAWAIVRAISRPIGELARAAASARLGDPIPPPAPGAPREVAELAGAMAAMQSRIAAQVEGRTAMLVAVAHDLGTPLSRIAFWIEQLPEAARTRAAADIEEMRAMLSDTLGAARDGRVGERTMVELGSVLDSLVDDLAVAGQPVTLTPGARAVVRGDPAALRRLFGNLIDNAVRYGERAGVGWRADAGRVEVTIEDNGQGFDEAVGGRLFEPFVRGDPSRSRATGGTGLGLAIARSLAEAHGGTVALGGTDGGGGRVTVTLPLA